MMCPQPSFNFDPLNTELNPTCHLLALLAHHIHHVSRLKAKTGFYDCWYTHYTASVLFNRILYEYNNVVGPLPWQIASFLCHVKDVIELKTAGVYSIPCTCGWVYIGQTGHSIAIRMKEHSGMSALNNGSMCNDRAHCQNGTSHPNPQHHIPIYVVHTIREATEWAPSQQEQWRWSSLGQVIETSHSLLEGMENTFQSPQGYNIMDLFMATDQPLEY